MADALVTCINKLPRENPYEGITSPQRARLEVDADQVIASIEAKTNTFFTFVNGKRADIGVVSGPTGKYLRTYADAEWNDNLLALPECGVGGG